MIINKIKNRLMQEKIKYEQQKENRIAKKLILYKQRPIYHIHIRKTAGTTINFAFLSNSGSVDTNDFYESIAQKSNHRQIKNGKVFVGWNVRLINEGNYSYAFSHTPLHKLNLQSDMFVFTCLRDPVKRVVSHYKMLRYYKKENINHPCMKIEGNWLGNSFEDFCENLPKEHLMNQLYMFSSEFDIQESFEKLMSLNKIIFTENLIDGLKELEVLTNWKLPISNQKKYDYEELIPSSQLDMLRNKLMPEYELIEMLKKEHNKV